MISDHQPEQTGGERIENAHDLFNNTKSFKAQVKANKNVACFHNVMDVKLGNPDDAACSGRRCGIKETTKWKSNGNQTEIKRVISLPTKIPEEVVESKRNVPTKALVRVVMVCVSEVADQRG